jgi:hypothetical protein
LEIETSVIVDPEPVREIERSLNFLFLSISSISSILFRFLIGNGRNHFWPLAPGSNLLSFSARSAVVYLFIIRHHGSHANTVSRSLMVPLYRPSISSSSNLYFSEGYPDE